MLESKANDQNDPNSLNDEEKKEEFTNKATSVGMLDDLMANLKLDDGAKSYRKTALFYHSDCLLHKPGKNRSHVERPERCSRPYEMLEQYGLLPYLMEKTAREATEQELKGSHKDSHVERNMELEGSGWFDSDTFYNEHSSRAAKLAAGATIDVMAGILEDKFENGFALVRPPGHHCEHGKGRKSIPDALSVSHSHFDSVLLSLKRWDSVCSIMRWSL